MKGTVICFICGACRLPAAIEAISDQFNKTAIIELYDAVDLIGLSSYAGKYSFLLHSLQVLDALCNLCSYFLQ